MSRTAQPEAPGAVPLWVEAPWLAALLLAPLLGSLATALGLQSGATGVFDPLPTFLLASLVWIGLLLRLLLPRLPAPRWPAAGWLPLALVASAALSFFGSANPGGTVAQTLLFATWTAAFWLAADCVARGGGNRLLAVIAGGAFLIAGLALQEYLIRLRGGEPGWRAYGGFINPNFLAGYLAPALLVSLGLSARMPESFKPLTWGVVTALLCGVPAAGLMVTQSRGGIYAAAGGLLVFLFLAAWRRGHDRQAWLRMATGGAAALVAVALLAGLLRGREQAVSSVALPPELCAEGPRSAAGESSRFRTLTWAGTVAMARQRPVQGWGAGSFDAEFAAHMKAGYTRHAHQGFLQLAAEQGLLGLLPLAALLLWAGGSCLVRGTSPRDVLVPAVGGAVACTAAHNFLDSILYVPATGLLTFTLLGYLFPPRGEEHPARKPSPWPRIAAAAAFLALLGCGAQVMGRSLLAQGRSLLSADARAASETLATAEFLLPWDYQIADAQRNAFLYQGEASRAAAAGLRAIRLAPSRAAGYLFLATVRDQAENRPEQAYAQLLVGLERVPRDVALQYQAAQLATRQRMNREALEHYRAITVLEDSEVGQVRALGEVRDYRYARARLVVARAEEQAGNLEAALAHWKKAACLLTERRVMFENGPETYFAFGERDPDRERELRNEEERLWRRIAGVYADRGEARLAELATAQAAAVEEGRARLEDILERYRAVLRSEQGVR